MSTKFNPFGGFFGNWDIPEELHTKLLISYRHWLNSGDKSMYLVYVSKVLMSTLPISSNV